MKTLALVGAFALAFVFVPRVIAAPPSGMARVDPAAPCYRWPAVDMDEDGVFDRVDHCVNTPRGCTVDAYGCESDEDRDGVCNGLDDCPGTPVGVKVTVRGCPDGQAAAPARVVPEVERQLVETGRIRLENIYFESASARLLPESEATLREVGETLERYPNLRIEVEGHSDTRGSARANRRLSQQRAESVRAYLLDHFQLRRENFTANGYGEARPETAERTEEEMLRNRRVVLRVLNPDALPRGVRIERPR
jgi:OOP family OmpA-OmpF porin